MVNYTEQNAIFKRSINRDIFGFFIYQNRQLFTQRLKQSALKDYSLSIIGRLEDRQYLLIRLKKAESEICHLTFHFTEGEFKESEVGAIHFTRDSEPKKRMRLVYLKENKIPKIIQTVNEDFVLNPVENEFLTLVLDVVNQLLPTIYHQSLLERGVIEKTPSKAKEIVGFNKNFNSSKPEEFSAAAGPSAAGAGPSAAGAGGKVSGPSVGKASKPKGSVKSKSKEENFNAALAEHNREQKENQALAELESYARGYKDIRNIATEQGPIEISKDVLNSLLNLYLTDIQISDETIDLYVSNPKLIPLNFRMLVFYYGLMNLNMNRYSVVAKGSRSMLQKSMESISQDTLNKLKRALQKEILNPKELQSSVNPSISLVPEIDILSNAISTVSELDPSLYILTGILTRGQAYIMKIFIKIMDIVLQSKVYLHDVKNYDNLYTEISNFKKQNKGKISLIFCTIPDRDAALELFQKKLNKLSRSLWETIFFNVVNLTNFLENKNIPIFKGLSVREYLANLRYKNISEKMLEEIDEVRELIRMIQPQINEYKELVARGVINSRGVPTGSAGDAGAAGGGAGGRAGGGGAGNARRRRRTRKN